MHAPERELASLPAEHTGSIRDLRFETYALFNGVVELASPCARYAPGAIRHDCPGAPLPPGHFILFFQNQNTSHGGTPNAKGVLEDFCNKISLDLARARRHLLPGVSSRLPVMPFSRLLSANPPDSILDPRGSANAPRLEPGQA
jgi:hypothetical protein